MQNRVQSAKKPCRLFTFGWSLLCWPSYRDTLFMVLQGKQLLQAVWSCLYTELPWISPCLTALHTHMSRVYFLGPDLSPLSPFVQWGSGRKFWDEFLLWMQTDLCVEWRAVWCCMDPLLMQANAGGQWDTCWVSNNSFPRGKVVWSKWQTLQQQA